jgi:hypothetical protein
LRIIIPFWWTAARTRTPIQHCQIHKARNVIERPPITAPEEMLQMWPVSRRVNRVGNDDDPKLIDAVQQDRKQP